MIGLSWTSGNSAVIGDDPQFPTLLSGYAKKPPFQVPGVDTFVGLPSAQTLALPTTLSGSGIAVNTSLKAVTLSGSNNITIRGIDFTNWQLEITGSGVYTIDKNNFTVGATNQICIEGFFCGGSINVTNNTFNGVDTLSPCAVRSGANLNCQNNWFHNCPDDTINVANPQGKSISIVFSNNLVNTSGAGEFHTDGLQTFNTGGDTGAITSVLYEHNLFYQPPSDISSINSIIRIGDQLSTTTVVVSNAIVRFNVAIFPTTDQISAEIFDLTSNGDGGLIGANIHDNYVDPTGLGALLDINVAYQDTSGVLKAVSYNTFNMVSGTIDLSGPFSNRFSGVPANPPSAPTISSHTTVGSTVAFVGTGPASTVINIMDTDLDIPIAETTSNGSGAWSVTTGTLTSGVHNFAARASDAFRNSSAPTATVSNTI